MKTDSSLSIDCSKAVRRSISDLEASFLRGVPLNEILTSTTLSVLVYEMEKMPPNINKNSGALQTLKPPCKGAWTTQNSGRPIDEIRRGGKGHCSFLIHANYISSLSLYFLT